MHLRALREPQGPCLLATVHTPRVLRGLPHLALERPRPCGRPETFFGSRAPDFQRRNTDSEHMARRSLHDRYFKDAKAEGYLARSAYKLLQIQEAKRLLKPSNRVLDLGCAPGSWLQVASEIVGPRGLVVGVDLSEVRHAMPDNVQTIVGDIGDLGPAQLIPQGERLFDVVLSDMAPNTSGHGDDMCSAHLCRRILELLPDVLAPGGNLAMKILEGADYPEILRETKSIFANSKAFKPKASRDVSREIYIVATSYAPHKHTGG